MRRTRWLGHAAGLLAIVAGTACGGSYGGGDGGTQGPDMAALSASRAEPSGDNQTGAPGEKLAHPTRIVVVRGGTPEAGAVVTWSAAGTGASMTPSVDTTGADGISSSVWLLGSEAGTQMAQASIDGADGSPVGFTATAQAPGGAPPPPSAVEVRLLTSGGNRFEPANVTVAVGTTVTWTWVAGFHDVTSSGSPAFPGSGAPVSAPTTFSHTFDTAGTYLYFCSIHGSPSGGMRGTIVVQ
jgi:plastocyanin